MEDWSILHTKSEAKDAKSAADLSDRLEQYWDSLRMETVYLRELGLKVVPDAETAISVKTFSVTDALALYHRLNGGGKQSCSSSPLFGSLEILGALWRVAFSHIQIRPYPDVQFRKKRHPKGCRIFFT